MEISYFLLREPLLAQCKFLSEMNIQIVNIIGEAFTNFADFFPFFIGFMDLSKAF